MELLNRAPSPEIVQQVDDIVKKCTAGLPIQSLFVRVIQPGRTRMVMAHVVLPTDFQVDGLPSLDAVRAETLKELKQHIWRQFSTWYLPPILPGAPLPV